MSLTSHRRNLQCTIQPSVVQVCCVDQYCTRVESVYFCRMSLVIYRKQTRPRTLLYTLRLSAVSTRFCCHSFSILVIEKYVSRAVNFQDILKLCECYDINRTGQSLRKFHIQTY